MPVFILDQALPILIVSSIVVGILLYLVDHFKTYVLDGSQDPVRITSLRYLQIFVALFTIALLAFAAAGSVLLLNVLRSGLETRAVSITQTQLATTLEASQTQQSEIDAENATPQVSDTPAPSPTPQPTPATTAIIGNTGGAGANMRVLPGLEGTILFSVTDGTIVIVLDESEEKNGFLWQKIALTDGLEGWVVANYLIYER